jgi:hypothetical protein
VTYEVAREADHLGKGLSKLLEQFHDRTALEAILGAWLTQIQKLEDASWEAILIRGIAASEGVGLDHIGNIVGRKRLGLDDPDYRIALWAKIRINRSSGRPNDMIDIANLSLTGTDCTITYDEHYPATIQMEVLGAVSFSVAVLFDNLVHAKCGGVKLWLIYSEQEPEDSFTFAPPGNVPVSDPQKGFADVGQTTGGYFVAVLGS